MHLLSTVQAMEILDAVHGHLHTVYLFPLALQEPAVAIMDGRDEGMFA